MARPLRIEFERALCDVLAPGNNRAAIFADDDDREAFLASLARVGRNSEAYCAACFSTFGKSRSFGSRRFL